LVFAAGFVVWTERFGGLATVDRVLQDNRAAVYGALASIFGSLLGFVIATISIVVAFDALPRLRIVRESATYDTLWKVFTSAIRWLGGATVGALLALVLDRGGGLGRLALYIAVGTGAIAVLRVWRCVWVLEKLVGIIVSRPPRTAPARAK
jgi:hypothetical protein